MTTLGSCIRHAIEKATLCALPLLLVACGGGGGQSPSSDVEPVFVLVEILGDDEDDDSDKQAEETAETIADIVEDTGAILLGGVPGTDFYRFALPLKMTQVEFAALLDDDIRVTNLEGDEYLDMPEGGGATLPLGGDLFAAEVLTQPELLRIGLLAAQSRATGRGVRIAVLDTGILPNHPLLIGRIDPGGRDFVDGDNDPTDVPNGLDDDGDGVIDEGYGHGTFVASLILAVAPDARIIPFRVLDSDSRGRASTLAAALTAAADLGVDVINLSVGMNTRVEVVRAAARRAEALGVSVVASAGNTGTDSVTYPAALGYGTSVTSTGPTDRLADFSSFGDEVDLSAPGVALVGAHPNGAARRWSGTSFSAALVSGAFALVREAFPALSAEDVVQRLVNTAVDVDPLNPGFSGEIGRGRLDLDAATTP